jgi:hypothetical protein
MSGSWLMEAMVMIVAVVIGGYCLGWLFMKCDEYLKRRRQ